MDDFIKFRRLYIPITSFIVILFLIGFNGLFPYLSIIENNPIYCLLISLVFYIFVLIIKKFSGVLLTLILFTPVIIIYNIQILSFWIYSVTFALLTADAMYSSNKKFAFSSLIVGLLIISTSIYFAIAYFATKTFTKDSIETVSSDEIETEEINKTSNQDSLDQISRDKRNELDKDYLIKEEKNKITIIINKWKTAWEDKDISKLGSFLTSDYEFYDLNGKKQTKKTRLGNMRSNLRKYSYVKIDIENLVIHIDDPDENDIKVEFIQTFSSNAYNDIGLKTLRLYKGEESNFEWKIYREFFDEYTPPTGKKGDTEKQQTIDYKNIPWVTTFCVGVLILLVIVIIIKYRH